uniref:Uncharacterized protein n=1 Tax=Romanomermis culicivorax TaxID=13658 RepID=A0A915L4Z1_ROMCU
MVDNKILWHFWNAPIWIDNVCNSSVEQAYQHLKATFTNKHEIAECILLFIDSRGYILFGDSIIGQVQIDNLTTLSMPGASLKQMAKFAHILSIVPERCIIIHLGIKDLVDFDGSTNYKTMNANALARCLVSTAMRISTEHDITVIISTILRRTGSHNHSGGQM